MKFKIILSVFLTVMPSIVLCTENIFSLDVTPEEAQKQISEQKLNIDYARKIGENPISSEKKNANGDIVYDGRIIKNPSDYIEEYYLANQHHGQDGLGRYLFHYEDWNQGRMEAKNSNGEIRGQYKYKYNANDNDIIVNYWADSLGFHHEDNLPKTVLEPVTDEPVVEAAKNEHFRLWKLAAEEANKNPDPMSDVYNSLANQYDEHQAQLEQANEIVGRNGQRPQIEYTEPKVYWEPSPNEVTSEPRGFFYSFEYPVKLLQNKNEINSRKIKRDSSNLEGNVNNEDNQNGILKNQVNVKNLNNNENNRVSAIHDVQIPRLPKSNIEIIDNENTKSDSNIALKNAKENVELSRISAVHDVQVPIYNQN